MPQDSKSNKRKANVIVGDYELVKFLGQGSMGKVKLGVHIKTKELAAVKIVRGSLSDSSSGRPVEKTDGEKKKERMREIRTIREAHIMMLLRHPHIVQLKDLFCINHHYYIIMDYVDGGQLLHYIVKHHRLSEDRARVFSRQLLSALDYMHRNNIVHRDLKIENILLDGAGKNIKIIDFGLSNLFSPEVRLTTYCGSLYFAAPELLRGVPYEGPEVDVWSLGVVIYVMVTGSVPFDDASLPGLHQKIKRGLVAYPAHISPECKNLLARIFATNPKRRITLADIRRHPWMNEGYKKAVKNYLPRRLPIGNSLSHFVLNRMVRGFNLGDIEDVTYKMELILSSDMYRNAAEHVAHIQIATADETVEELKKRPYDDPQSVPAAYHPLLSLYHLTRERIFENEFEFIPNLPGVVDDRVSITDGVLHSAGLDEDNKEPYDDTYNTLSDHTAHDENEYNSCPNTMSHFDSSCLAGLTSKFTETTQVTNADESGSLPPLTYDTSDSSDDKSVSSHTIKISSIRKDQDKPRRKTGFQQFIHKSTKFFSRLSKKMKLSKKVVY